MNKSITYTQTYWPNLEAKSVNIQNIDLYTNRVYFLGAVVVVDDDDGLSAYI